MHSGGPAKSVWSGEEGHYPHLQKSVEDKLRRLSPNNHHLRFETPVLSTAALCPQDRLLVSDDMQKWAQEMASRESLLKSHDSMNIVDTVGVRNSSVDYQGLKNSSVSKVVNEKNRMNNYPSTKTQEKPLRRPAPNDYTFWDKFDADSEVLKMELEDERIAEKKSVQRKMQEKQKLRTKIKIEEDTSILKAAINNTGAGDGLSYTEREFNAAQEKQKGNEYFQAGDMVRALDHYSRSVSFLPNVDAYNNRALMYLKLEDYSSAIEDCTTVLNMHPENDKAYYRRGKAFSALGKYQEALGDFTKAYEINPNDQAIRTSVEKTQLKLGIPTSTKRVRVPIQTKGNCEPFKTKSVEKDSNSESSNKHYPFFSVNPNENLALNSIGTAKIMCRCSGTPTFIKEYDSMDDVKDPGAVRLRRNSRPNQKDIVCIELPSKAVPKPNQKTDNFVRSTIFPDNDLVKSAKQEKELSEFCSPNHQANSAQGLNNNEALSNLEKLKTPFSFSVFWNSIKNVNDLPCVAKALRVLSPELVAQLVGEKLEEKMLSLFILALRAHFSIPDEWGVVQKYLYSFTQLPRFSFVNLMLEKGVKKELEQLLNEAERLGLRVIDLFQLYGLTSGPL